MEDHLKARSVVYFLVQVRRQLQALINMLLKSHRSLRKVGKTGGVFSPFETHSMKLFSNSDAKNANLRLPHEPELEDVHVASTLNGLVPRVVRDVVLFVLLEQVTSAHGVAALQQSLRQTEHQANNQGGFCRRRAEESRSSVCLTLSRTRMAEHCRGTPIILCGFQVTELALCRY